MHTAASNDNTAIIRVLIDALIPQGAKFYIDAADINGFRPLHIAASCNHVGAIGFLILKGADIEAVGVNGWTALHAAAENGHVHVIDLLVAKGANVHAASNTGCTPLHLACQVGCIKKVRNFIF